MTTIITKNGSGAPTAGQLAQGELAVDLTNKELYTKDSGGNVIKVGAQGGSTGTFTDLTATVSFTSPGIDDNATSTAITIDANENVGVGTDSPDHRLHVLGSFDTAGIYRDVDVDVSGAAANWAQFGAKKAGVETAASSFGGLLEVNGLSGSAVIQTRTGGALTEKMRIDASGFVTASAGVVAGTQTANATGSTTLDFSANQNFVLTLTGNVTLANPTTETVGQSGFIVMIQDGTGGRTVSLGTEYETAGGAGLSLSTTASTTDIVPYIVAASGRILLGAPQLAFA